MTEQNTPQTPWGPGDQPAPVQDPNAPAPAVSDPAAPVDQPADPTPAETDTAAETAPAKVGDLCTFTVEDDAGFETLHSCLVLEVFSEPDEDGQDVELARVAMLPDERIVTAARLELRS